MYGIKVTDLKTTHNSDTIWHQKKRKKRKKNNL